MTLSECYEILGIPRSAVEQEVKQAYREKAKQYHPDVCCSDNSEAQFIAINHAYETIMKYLEFKSSYGETLSELFVNTENITFNDRKRKERERWERVVRAQKLKQQREVEENAKYYAAYKEYRTGWKYNFGKAVAFVGFLMALLLFADFVSTPNEKKVFISNVEISGQDMFREYYLYFGDKSYYVSPSFYYKAVERKVLNMETTPLFGTVKRVYFKNSNDKEFSEWAHSLYYESLPLIILLLLFPLISFFLMKPNFTFVFVCINFNLYIAPLLIIVILTGDMRVIHLMQVLLGIL